MHRTATILLWLSAATFAWIGLYFLILPEDAAAAIDLGMPTDTALTDVQATYGGMVLGIAIFFAWAARAPGMTRAGLWSMLLVYGGLALGRVVAITGGAEPERLIWIFLGIEVAVTIASVWLLKRGGSAF